MMATITVFEFSIDDLGFDYQESRPSIFRSCQKELMQVLYYTLLVGRNFHFNTAPTAKKDMCGLYGNR